MKLKNSIVVFIALLIVSALLLLNYNFSQSCDCDSSSRYTIKIDFQYLQLANGNVSFASIGSKDSAFAYSNTEDGLRDGIASLKKRSPDDFRIAKREAELEELLNEGHPKEKYLFQCEMLRCDDYGISIYGDDGRLIFSHKGSYSLFPETEGHRD